MGNTCQTDENLKPSLYIEKPTKKSPPKKPNPLLQAHSPVPLISKSQKMMLQLGHHSSKDPDKFLKMQRKRHYKRFSHLFASDGQMPTPVPIKKALKKISYVSHLHLEPLFGYENSTARAKALVGPLKRFHRVSSLKLQTWQLKCSLFDAFYQIFKNLNSLQKLHLAFCIDLGQRSHEDLLRIPQAIKKCRALRQFSVKLHGGELATEKLFGHLLSTLKRKANLEILSVDIEKSSERARTTFMDTMAKQRHPKLKSICMKLSKTLTSKDFFMNFANVAPFLENLYLHLVWTEAGANHKAYKDEILALPEALKKLEKFHELYVKIQAQDLLSALKDTKSAIDNLISTNQLPLKSHFKAFSFLDREIKRKDLLNFYSRLTQQNYAPEIQMCLNSEKIYSMKGFCFKSPEMCPPGLSIAYICPINPKEAIEYNKEFCSLLDKVDNSSAITLDFVHNFKVEFSAFNKVFACLGKFNSLKSFGLDFSGWKTIDDFWIHQLFLFLSTLPQSLTSLNLKFSRCVKMGPQDIESFIGSLQSLNQMKNLAALSLNFDYAIQITNGNLSQLGQKIKNLDAIKSLSLSFKGCPGLNDEGVIQMLRNLSDLQELEVDFEGCKNVRKFLKLRSS